VKNDDTGLDEAKHGKANNNIVYVMNHAGNYHLAHHSSVQKLKEWLSKGTEGHGDHICLC
jgi:hypothetical protein